MGCVCHGSKSYLPLQVFKPVLSLRKVFYINVKKLGLNDDFVRSLSEADSERPTHYLIIMLFKHDHRLTCYVNDKINILLKKKNRFLEQNQLEKCYNIGTRISGSQCVPSIYTIILRADY